MLCAEFTCALCRVYLASPVLYLQFTCALCSLPCIACVLCRVHLALHVLCAVYLVLLVLYVEFTCALCRVHLSIYLCFVQSSSGPEGIPGAADDTGHDGQVQQLPSQGLCSCHQKWVPVLTPGITVASYAVFVANLN